MSKVFGLPAEWLSRIGTRADGGATPFDLKRWFAIVGLVSITALGIFAGAVLTNFVTERMLRQEGVLTMQFVQTVLLVENPSRVFAAKGDITDEKLREAFEHIAHMPDVLRANLYSAERELIWSSDKNLMGRKFEDNPELERALMGELVINEEGEADEAAHPKSEHAHLEQPLNYFVEIYVPVWDRNHSRVVGAVELYKSPRALFEAITAGTRLIWAGAVFCGAFLFMALFWNVRRADNLIRTQQERLVESERLAAVGELGSAVAHGIRNPLTAIRSSAELALEGDPELSKDAARDIMAEVDRLEQWVRELLSYSRPVAGKLGAVDPAPILRRCIGEFERDMERREIDGRIDVPEQLPAVRGDAMLLAQVVSSLIANALEAMESRGALRLIAEVLQGSRQVAIRLADTGPGMSEKQLSQAFKPFYTTKTKGLGVGLPLAKRIIERFGGSIAIDSRQGSGTTVTLLLPIAH